MEEAFSDMFHIGKMGRERKSGGNSRYWHRVVRVLHDWEERSYTHEAVYTRRYRPGGKIVIEAEIIVIQGKWLNPSFIV